VHGLQTMTLAAEGGEFMVGRVRRSAHAAELRSPVMTEVLMRAMAIVDAGFWALVADEVERRTARLYATEELAGRYFEV
jgi:hypothetical protein